MSTIPRHASLLLMTFVLSLASSAFVHLGDAPHPESQKLEANLPLAKQTIDILGMLQAKTKADEESLMAEIQSEA